MFANLTNIQYTGLLVKDRRINHGVILAKTKSSRKGTKLAENGAYLPNCAPSSCFFENN